MQLHAHPIPHADGIAGPALYGAGSLWWLIQSLAHYGPSWEALGPILMGSPRSTTGAPT